MLSDKILYRDIDLTADAMAQYNVIMDEIDEMAQITGEAWSLDREAGFQQAWSVRLIEGVVIGVGATVSMLGIGKLIKNIRRKHKS